MSVSEESEMSSTSTSTSLISRKQPLSSDDDDDVDMKENGDISHNNSELPGKHSRSKKGMKKSRGEKPPSRGRSPPRRQDCEGGCDGDDLPVRGASTTTKRTISPHGRGRSPMANFLDLSLEDATEVPHLAIQARYLRSTTSAQSLLHHPAEASSLPRVSSDPALDSSNISLPNRSKRRNISHMRRSKSLHCTPDPTMSPHGRGRSPMANLLDISLEDATEVPNLAIQARYQEITTSAPSLLHLPGEASSLPRVSSSPALASSNLKHPNHSKRRSISPARRIRPLHYTTDVPHLAAHDSYQERLIKAPSLRSLPTETSLSSLSRVSSSPSMARGGSLNQSQKRNTSLMRSTSLRHVPHLAIQRVPPLAIQVKYQERHVNSHSSLPPSIETKNYSLPRVSSSSSVAKQGSPNRSKRKSKSPIRRSKSADTYIPQNLATRQIRLGSLDATAGRRASSAAVGRSKPTLKRSKSADDILQYKSSRKVLSFDTTLAGNRPKGKRVRSKSPLRRQGSTAPVLSPSVLATRPGSLHREISVQSMNGQQQTSPSTSPTPRLLHDNSSKSIGSSYSVPIQSPSLLATRPGALYREISVQNLNSQQKQQSSPATSPRPRLLDENSSRSIGGSTHSRGLSRSPRRRMSPVPGRPSVIRKTQSADPRLLGDNSVKSTGSSCGPGGLMRRSPDHHSDYDIRSPAATTGNMPPLPRILVRENSVRSLGSNRGLRRPPGNRPSSVAVGRGGLRSLSPIPGKALYGDNSERSIGNSASKRRDSFSSIGSLSDSSHHFRSIHSLPLLPSILLEDSDDSDSSNASFHCNSLPTISLPTLPILQPAEPEKSGVGKGSIDAKQMYFLSQQAESEDSDVASRGRVPGSRRSPVRRRGLSRENSLKGTASRRGLRCRSKSPGRRKSPGLSRDGSKRSIGSGASPKHDSNSSLLGDLLGDSSKSSGHLLPPLQPAPASTAANTDDGELTGNSQDGDKTKRQSSENDEPKNDTETEKAAERKSQSRPQVLASEDTPQVGGVHVDGPPASNTKQGATLNDLESNVLRHFRSRSLSPPRPQRQEALQSTTNGTTSSTMAGMQRRILGALESNSLKRRRGRSYSPRRPRKTVADLEKNYANKKKGKLRTVMSSVSGSATSATISLREDLRMNGTASSSMNWPYLRTLSSERTPFASNRTMSNSASSNRARSGPTPSSAPRPLPTHPERVTISSTDLVEARTVSDSDLYDPESVSVASEYTPEEREIIARKRQKLVYFGNTICGMVVVTIGVAILVLYAAGVFNGPTQSTQVNVSGSTFPTSSPSLAPTPYLVPLPEFSVKAIEDDPHSAQAKAYEWLKEDGSGSLQRFALVTFYYSMGGEDWTVQENWLSHEHHECNWHSKAADIEGDRGGVCDEEGHYLSLLMTKNGLSGRLTPEIGLLSNLLAFDVASNDVGGSMPSELGFLTSLTELAVDINGLSGSFPTEIGQLKELQTLLVHNNPQLAGTMPTELGQLSELRSLEWSYTGTSGRIPSQLGSLNKMTGLYLAENSLEGSIPTQIFSISSLSELLILDSNLLTGTVPTQIGLLSNLSLVYMNENLLEGTVPTQVGKLRNATKLFLYQNQLTGPLPSQLGKLSRLERINFFQNSLTGAIPSELGQCTNLKSIDFEVNHLSSSVPWEVFQHLNLTKLYLSSNELRGPISSTIGHLESLEKLRLDFNAFSGTIPPEFFYLYNLLELWLGNNHFISGTIPPQMGNLLSLSDLRLDNANLRGNIPTEMEGVLENLQFLYLQNTSLSGILPYEACSIPDLHFNCSDLLCGCYCVCLHTIGNGFSR